MTEKQCVRRDGVVRFIGTGNQCCEYLLKAQGQSIDWACKYEGWAIETMARVATEDKEVRPLAGGFAAIGAESGIVYAHCETEDMVFEVVTYGRLVFTMPDGCEDLGDLIDLHNEETN